MLRTMQIYMNCVMFLKELARESSTNARKYCRLSFCAVLRFKVGLLAPFSFPSTSTSTAYDGKHECASQNHDQAEANIGLLERETSRPRSHEHFSNTEGDIDFVFTHIAMRRPSLNFTTPTPPTPTPPHKPTPQHLNAVRHTQTPRGSPQCFSFKHCIKIKKNFPPGYPMQMSISFRPKSATKGSS